MKTMHIACTFFLILGISASIFSKTPHHFITIYNNTQHDIILTEFEQNTKKNTHTISSHSDKKCDFFKSTDYVEAKVKLGSAVYYNVGSPITSGTKTISITQKKTLHIRAQ